MVNQENQQMAKQKNDAEKILSGKKIKKIRTENNLTFVEFGKIFGVSSGTVSNWENGKCLPNKKRLQEIAELGNTTIQAILSGNELI